MTGLQYWWRSNISRRWINRITVKDLDGLIIPLNDQTLGGRWMQFIGEPDNRFLIKSPDLFTNRKMILLKEAHKKAIMISSDVDSYARALKTILLGYGI